MNILWFSMFPLPKILNKIDSDSAPVNVGGWMDGMSRKVIESNNVFSYCFAYDKVTEGTIDNKYRYFTTDRIKDFNSYSIKDLERLKYILDKTKPDIIQIFGTEHSHQAQLVKMLDKLGYIDKTVIWIQGLVSTYAKYYNSDLSQEVINQRTLKEYIKHNNIKDMRLDMEERGKEEVEALKIAKHVFVRTHWDEAECKKINKNLIFHYCNETLRYTFYNSKKWSYDNCRKHSIFVSQANYPIKALHKLLEAMPKILTKYPDTVIYTTGTDYLNYTSPFDKLRLSSYQKYLIKLIKKHGLEDKVRILGSLSADEMIEQFLNANVLVSPSSIENSPSSIGEAMILGTPIVSSDVGGVSSLLVDNKEGILYDFSNTDMLAESIIRIFSDNELAERLSNNAIKKAEKTHNKQANYETLIKEYKSICG